MEENKGFNKSSVGNYKIKQKEGKVRLSNINNSENTRKQLNRQPFQSKKKKILKTLQLEMLHTNDFIISQEFATEWLSYLNLGKQERTQS